MRVLRRYDHGGTHFEDLSDKQKAFQRAVDTIEYTGERGKKKYGVGDLLSMLQFTNMTDQKTDQEFMNDIFSVSSPEEREATQPNFRAFKTKDGSIRITSLDPESGKYNPSTTARGMSGDQLSDLAGRPLTGTEEREFRSLLMSDPAFLDYFIDIEEKEPKKREFKKINVAKNVGRRGVPGGGKGNVAGSRSLEKDQGKAGIVDFLQDFCERNSRHPSCR